MLLEKHRNSLSDDEMALEEHEEVIESAAGFAVKRNENNQELRLEKQKKGACGRKYCCEKCSYCSAHKENFKRHISLHGSRQR